MISWRFLAALTIGLAVSGMAKAEFCEHNPDALGTSRVLQLDPNEWPRIGRMQYPQTLPLEDKEVVITFDDGPLPPYTNQVLESLAAECVRATFFIVGRMARAYPSYVKRTAHEGHTIATHTMNHVLIFPRITSAVAQKEIGDAYLWTQRALGEDYHVTPFFRFPGLGRTAKNEKYLQEHSLMVWSADFPADDWTHISGDEVMKRALQRLEKAGKGVLLLHDIQPATAVMLPALLKELKARGFKVVHVEPKPQPNAYLEANAKAAAEPIPVVAKKAAKGPTKQAKPVMPGAMGISQSEEPKTRPLWPKTSRETSQATVPAKPAAPHPGKTSEPALNTPAMEAVTPTTTQSIPVTAPTATRSPAKRSVKPVVHAPTSIAPMMISPPQAAPPLTTGDAPMLGPNDFMTMMKNLDR